MPPLRALVLALLPGLAVAATVRGWSGLMLWPLITSLVWGWLRRREPRVTRRERKRAMSQLPLAADLLAAALRAGSPPELAALMVGEALAGPLGERLVRVARALRIGMNPQEAWSGLTGIPGAERIARAATRSAGSGAVLTTTLDRLSEDLRADRAARAEATAQRIGVLAVLPLGLCFLPAFFLAGVVPVAAAVFGDVIHN
jgi:Flp pilus assembly protein TadB